MTEPYRLPAAVQDRVREIEIRIDPRIELLAIVQSLGAYAAHLPFLLNQSDLPYRVEVQEAFGAYADHAAVGWLDDICLQPGMYNFGAPPTSMLYLDDRLRLRGDLIPDSFTLRRAGGVGEFLRFAGLLAEFGALTGFGDFFARHSAYYRRLIDGVRKTVEADEAIDFVAQLQGFYGTHHRSYTLILAPLYGTVGFGPLVKATDGATSVYSILGPRGQTGDLAVFGDGAYFKYMQQHEFSHSFVNPLSTKYADLVSRYAPLFARMPPDATQKVCGEWEECVNEQVIRAITTYFAFQESKAVGQTALAAEQARGLPFVEVFLAGIREYAASRDRYPTLDAYYPRLLARLADV